MLNLFSRSIACASRVNSLKLVTDQILDFTPQSSANICAAFSTSLRMVPLPSNCTSASESLRNW
ncbi:hypothetical protein [uncultured Gammaproteobacteria bacterium]|nr:hypothetical protein [uncultured Gammaproteobacteria bacterium]